MRAKEYKSENKKGFRSLKEMQLWRSVLLSLLLLATYTVPLQATVAGGGSDTIALATDSAFASSSIATAGGQKIVEDAMGKLIAVYVDTSGRLAIAYSNYNPSTPGSWSQPTKSSAPAVAFSRPAAVLMDASSLRIIVEGGQGAGFIVDISVGIQRDQLSNIVFVSFGTGFPIDVSGRASHPTAIRAANGDILAAWRWTDSPSSRVKSFRWTPGLGWVGFNGSSKVPDDAIVDKSNRVGIFPSIIQRQDNFHAYVVGNRDSSSSTSTLAFNKATFDGLNWSWGVQDLNFESNAARGIEDVPSLAWDPSRSLVAGSYDISGSTKYGVFTLDSLDRKSHSDTPSLAISDNSWGSLVVEPQSGEYYIFMIDSASSGAGRFGYTRKSAGSWNTTLTVIDSATNNAGVSAKKSTGPSIDVLYLQGTTSPGTVRFIRVSTLRPTTLTLGASPVQLFPGQTTLLSGALTDNNETGLPGKLVQIQRSFNLQNWTPLTSTTTVGGGNFSTITTFSFPSTYYLRASFSNDAIYYSAISYAVEVAVVGPSSGSFSFGAGGDFDSTSAATATLDLVPSTESSFFLALGDLSYDSMSETSWCNYVKTHVGSTFPFELVSGNHDDGGSIDDFAGCLPDRIGSIVGSYAKEYYFDFPSSAPLARILMISPDITFTNGGYYSYEVGTPHYQWLSNAIDGARATGIPWVIVGMHKVCISEGTKSCQIGADLMNLLISRNVDLVLQAHDHDYQRSKQLTCAFVDAFNASCVADDGSDDLYGKGNGTVFVIAGISGRDLSSISSSDPEASYFARAFGSGSIGSGNGFVKYTVSPERIDAEVIMTIGTFSDAFSILSDNNPPGLTVPNESAVTDGSSLTFTVNAADSDLPSQTISLSVSALPSGASFSTVPGNPAYGTFTWTPSSGQRGVWTITFTAQDNGSPALSNSRNATITVSASPLVVESLHMNPATPWAGGQVSFAADITGIVSPYNVRWDFDSDGNTDTDGNPANWTYQVSGNFTITAYAVDFSGAKSPPLTMVVLVTPWQLSSFRLDWADYDNNGRVDIVDMSAALYCYDASLGVQLWAYCEYWDFDLSGRVGISEVAIMALNFQMSMHTPFPGQGRPRGYIDPAWHDFCSVLLPVDVQYCARRF